MSLCQCQCTCYVRSVTLMSILLVVHLAVWFSEDDGYTQLHETSNIISDVIEAK